MSEESQFSSAVPALQLAWDNTSISMLKDCPRKYKYAIVDGWRLQAPSAPLVFGLAYHEVVESYDKQRANGVGSDLALENCLKLAFELSEGWELYDTARTRESLVRSIVYYADEYANDSLRVHRFADGTPALEVSFRFELPFKTSAGEPYLYSGHIDKLAEYNGQLFALERKTTKSALSDHYFVRYIFSSQVTGYVYAGKVVFHKPVAGAIIESCQVGVNFVRFGRRLVSRVNEHLEEWMTDLHLWIELAERYALKGYWPLNTESCGKYSGCQFRNVCTKPPHVRELVLRTEFVKDRWNPLKNRGDD